MSTLRAAVDVPRLSPDPMPEVVRGEGAFLLAVRRERRRSDRYGGSFSVVAFSPDQRPDRALDRVTRRARETDVVALVDRVVLVLLPRTGESGAASFVGDVRATARHREMGSVQIMGYPGQKGLERRIQGMLSTARAGSPEPYCPWWKRWIDLSVATVGLVLTAPLMLTIAVGIRLVSPGPVVLRQVRIGERGRPFEMLKFRTMRADTSPEPHREYSVGFIQNPSKPMGKVDSSSGVIRGGRLLRASGLDELPQLVNVLRGEMSIVGPRPCLPYEAEAYAPWHHRRLVPRPGVTGLWQVAGKNCLTFPEMVRLDLEHAGRPSFLREMGVLLRTPVVMLRGGFRCLWGPQS